MYDDKDVDQGPAMDGTASAEHEQPATAGTDERPEPELMIVVPVYNEAGAIEEAVERMDKMIRESGIDAEVIWVDDGSTDGSAEILEKLGANVYRCPENRGYGHALKTGIRNTRSKFVAITDADGTYPSEDIPRMLEMARSVDMVVGDRGKAMSNVPLVRKPAKWLLNKTANLLAGHKINDLNSGLRVFRRESLEKFLDLLPDGFSFTTTITLCMFGSGHKVVYTPIEYGRRVGHSKIRPTDFFRFMMLVVRIVTLFSPLRVFMPLGAALFFLGLVKLAYDITQWNLSETAVFAFLAALMIWSFGLLADMISRLHLRP
ncbi:glycosyltransferase family 2 protein [Parvularcula lutaonensis]|uniref:Glycosyltransferase family 2 protein n=1 Tax=Parvularcula lutaonensis TaxID=491923 RepID=A0ABV7M8F7_9PROT|nr:glycosyltransferase family 2 protein [Parvularcula lutaonensis]GGY44460.1 glycosyl transferase [Parvularcula lutaonensis]